MQAWCSAPPLLYSPKPKEWCCLWWTDLGLSINITNNQQSSLLPPSPPHTHRPIGQPDGDKSFLGDSRLCQVDQPLHHPLITSVSQGKGHPRSPILAYTPLTKIPCVHTCGHRELSFLSLVFIFIPETSELMDGNSRDPVCHSPL